MEPKVRFKGFEGEWKTPSIGDVFELRNGYTPSKIVKEFWEGGTIPWFRMEDIRMNGGFLKDSLQHITPLAVKGAGLFEKRSIILATTATIGVHAMLIADSLANQRFTNFKVRKSLSDEYIDEFIYYSFFKIDEWSINNTNSGGLLSVNMPLLVKQGFLTPCKEEQQAIATYFLTLDSKIQSTSKKLASLKKLKSASLVAMFPQNGESMPKVRFKGFEGEWSTNNLGSIFAERIESNENGEMLSVTMNNGIIRSSDNGRFDNSNSDKSKYKVVKIGDIAYNSMRMWQGASGVSQYEGIVSPAYTVVTPSVDVDTDFFGYLFKTDDVIRLFKLNSQGLTSDNWNLKYPAFSRICVSYPKSKEEQQAIAAYFRSLDRKIALETARLEKLKQIKLACLDKMFV